MACAYGVYYIVRHDTSLQCDKLRSVLAGSFSDFQSIAPVQDDVLVGYTLEPTR